MMTNEQSVFSSLFFSLQPSFHTICYAITIPQSISFFNIFLYFRIFYSFLWILFYIFDLLKILHTEFFTKITLFFITSSPSPTKPAMLSFPDFPILLQAILHLHHPVHLLSGMLFPLASLDPDFSSHRRLPRIILRFVFNLHQ